ncbi:MAG: hypothetical protein ACRELD_02750 [Longimicrobiales bacterium]
MSYQPDWLRQIKVTRNLESGRQSTKTLIRNPAADFEPPGPRVRTRIESKSQHLDIEVILDDPRHAVRRITVETTLSGDGVTEPVVFTIDATR